jgi:hypothetical protein
MKRAKKTKNRPVTQNLADSVQEPTREEIMSLAYSFWEQAGRPEGRALEHWLLAETQLRQRRAPGPSAGA